MCWSGSLYQRARTLRLQPSDASRSAVACELAPLSSLRRVVERHTNAPQFIRESAHEGSPVGGFGRSTRSARRRTQAIHEAEMSPIPIHVRNLNCE
jgi:hypothetical protein